MNKVLIIGQLPKEAGGSYTTGIARVVENLYKFDFENVDVFWYFTNVPNGVAKTKCPPHCFGYKIRPFHMMWHFLLNPIRTIKEWKHYSIYDGINPLHYDCYRDNFERVIGNINPNLIHLHGGGMSPLYYANRKYKKLLLLTLHGVMYNQNDENSWIYKKMYTGFMNMPNYFTVLNRETKKKALLIGMPEDKCTIVPNGVDCSHFYYSETERAMLREKYNIGDKTKVFITVGGVMDRKGQFDFLLLLENLELDYQYWIVGQGPDESRIDEYVRNHHLKEKVRLFGYVNGYELYKFHSAADFYAHVSTTEGQALSEIEAYATGLKIIVRKEVSETVAGDVRQDNETYYELDMECEEREKLKKWINNPNNVRCSRGGCDWKTVVTEYSKVYNMLLGRCKNGKGNLNSN